jgi:uncharacterized membrane protein YtjA (UPF0391 family)
MPLVLLVCSQRFIHASQALHDPGVCILASHLRNYRDRMLPLALVFFIAAALAAAIGYTRVMGVTLAPARALFFIFLVCTLIALIGEAMRDRHSQRIR